MPTLVPALLLSAVFALVPLAFERLARRTPIS